MSLQQLAPTVHAFPFAAHGAVHTPLTQLWLQHWAFVVQVLPIGAHVVEGGAHAPFTQLPLQQSAFVEHAPLVAWHGEVHFPLVHWPPQHWAFVVQAPAMGTQGRGG